MTKTPFTVNHKTICGKMSPFICKRQLKSPSEGTAVRDIALNHLFGCFTSLTEHPTGAGRQRKKSKGNNIHCYSKHFCLFQCLLLPHVFWCGPSDFASMGILLPIRPLQDLRKLFCWNLSRQEAAVLFLESWLHLGLASAAQNSEL